MFKMLLTSMVLMFEWMQNLYDMLHLMIGADRTERFLADECEEPRRMKSFQSFPKLKKNEPESRPHPVLRLADKEQNDWESFVDVKMTSVEDDGDGVVFITDSNRKGSLYCCLKSPYNDYYEANNSKSAIKEEPLEISKPAKDLEPPEEET